MSKPEDDKPVDRMPRYEADEAPAPAEAIEGRPAWADPAAPRDYDSDAPGGGGRIDFVPDEAPPEGGADAPSHGSR